MYIPPHPVTLHRLVSSIILFFASFVTALHAQRITVTDRHAAPVAIESAEITTEITGRIAVTTFDLVFRNPNNRQLEGTFEFPLLEGQSVVGLSLDINGRQREAVPIEKERGRAVFEEIVRRRVDPALLEKTSGNNYRLRIFPLTANGTRRVTISYQENLSSASGNPVYRLLLNFPAPLDLFRLAVNVQSAGATPAKVRTTLPLQLPEWRNSRQLELQQSRFEARGLLEIELPPLDQPQVLTQRHGDNEYFYAELPLEGFKPVAHSLSPVIGLLWDASGSGRQRNHTRELALLDRWFDAVKNVEVRLQVFRDQAESPISFKVVNGDWTTLRDELKTMTYDGATSFDGIADDPAVGEWLMFSDGLANYGISRTLPLHAPVHTILASTQADASFLRALAHRHSGVFVNLLRTTPENATQLLRQECLRVLRIEHNPEECAQLFPEPNTPVDDGQLVVTGILKAPDTTIRLLVGHNASDAREIELTVKTGEHPSQLAARAWGAKKISQLEMNPMANREDIRRTSQAFHIVSANTSLIVLETLTDYLNYDIIPPTELREAWEASHRSAQQTLNSSKSTKLDSLSRLVSDKLRWWDSMYPVELLPIPANPPTRIFENGSMSSGSKLREETSPDGVLGKTTSQLPGSRGEEVIILSPFTVEAEVTRGYYASQTLSGSRINTRMYDVASSVSTSTGSQTNRYDDSTTDEEDEPEATANENDNPPPASGITLRRWEPKAGYLDRLRRVAPEKRYAVYLEERSDHTTRPGFFLDAAEFFFEKNNSPLALRILSNLAELQLDDPSLLRVLAHRLVQAGHPELALPLFERILVLRPEEPQSRRDLALVCATLKQNQRASDLLWEVVCGPWDGRFPQIELIALGELNAIIATCGEKLDLSKMDPRFLQNIPVGLRVILTWDTDDCDIDLWVKDPRGEDAFYYHPRTTQNGRMSCDFTAGYGPEEFLLRNPEPGKYTVRINYFGDSRKTLLGPVTAQIRLITNFGTLEQKEKLLTVRLNERKENVTIGEIVIGQ